MSSSVLVKDGWGNVIHSTAEYSAGDTASHGARTANTIVSNSSLGSGTYWLFYSGSIHGGTSYHAAVQSEIDLKERYIIN